jgi:hypothetical protein
MFVQATAGVTVDILSPPPFLRLDIFGDPAGQDIFKIVTEAGLITAVDLHAVNIFQEDAAMVTSGFNVKEEEPAVPEGDEEDEPAASSKRPPTPPIYYSGGGSGSIEGIRPF